MPDSKRDPAAPAASTTASTEASPPTTGRSSSATSAVTRGLPAAKPTRTQERKSANSDRPLASLAPIGVDEGLTYEELDAIVRQDEEKEGKVTRGLPSSSWKRGKRKDKKKTREEYLDGVKEQVEKAIRNRIL